MTTEAGAAATLSFPDLGELRRRRSYKWRSHGPDVLPVHVAELDVRTAEPIRAVLADMVDGGDLGYRLAGDLPEVYADFAAWRYGQRLDPADVHLVGDVMQGVYVALRLLAAPGDGVVICPPVYHPFFSAIPAAGASVVEVPLARLAAGFEFDLDGLATAFAAGAGFLLLCHPHNPVGRVWTGAELAAVAGLAERYGVQVISDEIHAPLVYDGVPFVPYATVAPDAVTLVAASKAWNLPGLKTALALTGSVALRRRWADVPELADVAAGLLGVVATRTAFADGRAWLDELVTHLQGNRDALPGLLSALPGVGYVPPEATFLAWLDCTGLGLGDDPAAVFEARGRVALDPGARFGAGPGHARLNFGTSRELLTEAVRRMAVALG